MQLRAGLSRCWAVLSGWASTRRTSAAGGIPDFVASDGNVIRLPNRRSSKPIAAQPSPPPFMFNWWTITQMDFWLDQQGRLSRPLPWFGVGGAEPQLRAQEWAIAEEALRPSWPNQNRDA
jgi:hypothetical protein